MKILDVSKFQPIIDYAAVAREVDGVILRCGYTGWGTSNECNKDPYFEQHYAGFKAVGLPVGVYYYSAADTIAKTAEEAAFCIELLAGKQFELPIYYDVECTQRMESLAKDQLTSQVITWCDAMEQAGYFVGVYSYTAFFQSNLHIDRLAQKYTIWLADYRQNYDCTIPRDMHQYTSTANISGISGGVDMSNLFRTDLPEIIKNGGFNGFDPTPTETVQLVSVTVGPVSAGDREAFKALAEKLGIGVTVATVAPNLETVTTAGMTAGDVEAFRQLAEKLQVGFDKE